MILAFHLYYAHVFGSFGLWSVPRYRCVEETFNMSHLMWWWSHHGPANFFLSQTWQFYAFEINLTFFFSVVKTEIIETSTVTQTILNIFGHDWTLNTFAIVMPKCFFFFANRWSMVVSVHKSIRTFTQHHKQKYHFLWNVKFFEGWRGKWSTTTINGTAYNNNNSVPN